MNKKLWIGLSLIVVIIVAIVLVTRKPETTSTDTIKIGVVSPMTGPKSKLGEGLKQAIILAQTDIGTTKKHYEFIYEDSKGDAAAGAAAAQKLIAINKVNALVSISSQDGNIVALAAQNAHIPHFGIANDTHVENGDYSFTHWAPAEAQAQLMATELQKRGLKKVAFLMEQNDAWVAALSGFETAIANTDVKIAYQEKFVTGTSDFRTMLQKVKQANPDVLLIEAFSPMAEQMAKQAKELGLKPVITSITAFGVVKDFTPFEGNWFVSGKLSTEDFAKKFEAQAGYPQTIGANYGYDVARILIAAYDNATDISGPTMRDTLRSFDYSSVPSSVGTLVGLNEKGRIKSEAAVLMIKNGQQVNYTDAQ
jgi:branched-chain amino acid transport system substrate-binding protein